MVASMNGVPPKAAPVKTNLNKKEEDNFQQIKNKLTTGDLFYKNKDYKNAADFYKEALPMAEKAGKTKLIADILQAIGHCEYYSGRIEEAQNYYKRALAQAEKSNPEKIQAIKEDIFECEKALKAKQGGQTQAHKSDFARIREQAIKRSLSIIYQRDMFKDGFIDENEMKELVNKGISKAFLDYLNAGGIERGTVDNKITREEFEAGMKKILNEDTIKALSAHGKKHEEVIASVIEDFKICKDIAWVSCDEAVKEYKEKYNSQSQLFEGENLKLREWLDKGCNPELREAAQFAASRILGFEFSKIDGNTKLNIQQFTSLLYALALASSSKDPSKYGLKTVEKAGIIEGANVLAWATRGGAFKAEDKKAEEKTGQGQGLSTEEQKELMSIQYGTFKGTTSEAVKKLEELKSKDPENVGLRTLLVGKYVSVEKYEEALNESVFVFEKDPVDVQAKQNLTATAFKFYRLAENKELSSLQRDLIKRVGRMLKGISDVESDKDKKTQLEALSKGMEQMGSEPLPGQAGYQIVLKKDDSKLIEIKTAYDTWASTLIKSVGDNSISSQIKIRGYVQLAKIEVTRRNYSKAEEFAKKALELYKNADSKDIKESVREEIKGIIEQLCQFRNVDKITIARRIIEYAESQNILKEFDIKIKIHKKEKGKLTAETEENTVKKSSDLQDLLKEGYRPTPADETSIYFSSITERDDFDSLPRTTRSQIYLSVLYAIKQKGCLKELQRWAVQYKGKKEIPESLNPYGKFGSEEKAVKLLQALIDYKPPKPAKSEA